MDRNYCGKSCDLCDHREALGCGGCRSRTQHCEIARCCLGKGHDACESCEFKRNCYKLLRREKIPADRLMELDRAAQKEAELARNAPLMAKWLWLMLWMNVPALLIGLPGELGDMTVFSEVGGAVCGLIVCWMLLQLKPVCGNYRKAALCTTAAVVLNLAASFITGGWQLLVLLPAAVVSLVGSYTEYHTHGDVVGAVDAALGERWRNLWKWQVISIGCMLGGVVFMLIAPVLGALVVLAGSLAAAVVSIMTIVNLYKSAQAFRKLVNQQKETV